MTGLCLSFGEERDSSWPFVASGLSEELIPAAVLQEKQVGRGLHYFIERYVSL